MATHEPYRCGRCGGYLFVVLTSAMGGCRVICKGVDGCNADVTCADLVTAFQKISEPLTDGEKAEKTASLIHALETGRRP